MAIVKMEKFNLLSFKEDRDVLLKKLQEFDYVHFNDLKVDEDEDYIEEVLNSKSILDVDNRISKTNFAIGLLDEYTEKKSSIDQLKEEIKKYSLKEINEKANNFRFDQVYDELKELYDLHNEKENELSKNKSMIDELSPWKDITIDIDELYNLKRVFVETGTIADRYYDDLMINFEKSSLKESYILKISEPGDTTYMVAISTLDQKDEFVEFLRENGFVTVKIRASHSVSDKLNELNEDGKKIKNEISSIEDNIKGYTKYILDFRVQEAYLKNLKIKESSVENFLKTKNIDYIEGYVPSDMASTFRSELREVLGNDYVLDMKQADKDDPNVPIILKNNRFTTPFETVTSMYSLPRYNEIDPTPLFAPFYAIFTGFMVGDLGYGLILTIAILIALNKFNLPKATEKTVRMFLRVGISASIWGLIFGSFFGGVIELPSLIDPQKDYMALIILSLVLGVIAMFYALGIKGYMDIRDGHVLSAVFDVLFWYMAVAGAILALLSNMGVISKDLNKLMLIIMIIGMVGIVLTGGRDEKSVGGKIGWGIYSLYGITSWVGEFVSFLRLMALVLSGGFVAYAVNMICQMLVGGGVIGIIFSVVVFLVFQGFNMFLSYLSSYVHAARLIFVEMFNKFYEGGGKAFNKMIEDTKFIQVIKGGK